MTAELTAILRQTDLLGCAARRGPGGHRRGLPAAHRSAAARWCSAPVTRATRLIVVVSGRVKVVVRSADGAELTLTVIRPHGVFGELSVADSGPRSADAETLEESQLLLIPRETIQRACAQQPALAQALTGSLAATLRRLTEATSDLVFLDLPRRVAKVLLSQPRGADGRIRSRMSQQELSHQAGSTRQSVNAALRGFERRGWIRVRDRAVIVQQEAALGAFARGEMSAS